MPPVALIRPDTNLIMASGLHIEMTADSLLKDKTCPPAASLSIMQHESIGFHGLVWEDEDRATSIYIPLCLKWNLLFFRSSNQSGQETFCAIENHFQCSFDGYSASTISTTLDGSLFSVRNPPSHIQRVCCTQNKPSILCHGT